MMKGWLEDGEDPERRQMRLELSNDIVAARTELQEIRRVVADSRETHKIDLICGWNWALITASEEAFTEMKLRDSFPPCD